MEKKKPQIDAQTSAAREDEGKEEKEEERRRRRCKILEKRSVAGRRVFTAIWASGGNSDQTKPDQNLHDQNQQSSRVSEKTC